MVKLNARAVAIVLAMHAVVTGVLPSRVLAADVFTALAESTSFTVGEEVVKTVGLASEVAKTINQKGETLTALNQKLQTLAELYDKNEFARDLRAKGLLKENPLEKTKKAVNTLNNKLDGIHSKIYTTNNKIIAKHIANNIEEVGKWGNYASWAMVGVELISDVTQFSGRVEEGSSEVAEGLNMLLKVVENIKPIGVPGLKSPSDVGRAIIDLTNALKERDKGLLNQVNHYGDITLGLAIGENAIEQVLARKLENALAAKGAGDIDFVELYNSAKRDHLNHLLKMAELMTDYVMFLNDTKAEVTDPSIKGYLAHLLTPTSDQLSTLQAFINNINGSLDVIREEIEHVRKGKGFDIVVEYASWHIADQTAKLAQETKGAMSNLSVSINKSIGLMEEYQAVFEKVEKSGLTPEQKAALIEHYKKIADENLAKDIADKVIDNTKTIETTRKLELDRQLAKFDVDIFFLADNTGSMGGLISSVQTHAQAILDGLRDDSRFSKVNAQFGVGMYLGDPSEGGETATSAYQLLQPITNTDSEVTAAINQWYASGGGDWEEANFYAIQQAITNGAAVPRDSGLKSNQATGWRSGAEKVIVVFGDAPSWQNSVNEKELKELIKTTGAKVVFIDTSQINYGQQQNVYDATSGQQMQDAALEIADASGGSYMQLADVSQVKDAVLDSVYDAIADNKWTGGMLARVDGSTRWRVRTPSSVTAKSNDGGDTLTFTLSYPNQDDSTFTVDTTSAVKVSGHEYYRGTIPDATNIFGQDMSVSAVFHTNAAQDFYRYVLRGNVGVLEGYYGERLSSSSKLPGSGVSTYDFRQRVISPYGSKVSTSSGGMKMFIDWTSGKVYAFENDALANSHGGTSIFIGYVDRTDLEIGGEYVFKTRRLTTGESSDIPRFIKDAMRDTTTLQFYGGSFPNGIGGTFGATYYDESKAPTLSSMLMSGFLNEKTVSTVYSPSNNEVWKGYAVGLVANRSTGAVSIASNSSVDDVQMTLRPSSATAKADITVSDGTSYNLATDWTDTSVYVNKDAFAAIKEVNGVPSYAATTMTEDDGYNYLSWGVWSTEVAASPNTTVMDGSHWIAGKMTPSVDVPTSGSAIYSGQIRGMAHEGAALHSLNGNHTMTANFGTGNITGQLNIKYAETGNTYATSNLSSVSISGNGFGGSLSGSDNTGAIRGSFYGPAANEVGGSWEVNKAASKAAGVFAGQKE